MKRLINYFIRYGISGNLLMVLIMIFGIFGLYSLRSTFFPQVPIQFVNIQAVYPGASPEEIEESVVLKIEDQLKGVTGVERVTSTSTENAATVQVEITRGNDVEEVLQDVKNAVDQISSFPTALETIEIFKVENRNNAITFAITGTDDLKKLKLMARRIERDLLAVDGISKVDLSGFPDEEISIEFSEERLRAYGLTMQGVMNRVASANIEITGGTIKGPNEEFNIRLKNKSYYGEGLEDMVVVAQPDGRVVYLNDVATIRDKWAEAPDRNFLSGEPAVMIDVHYTNDEDLLTIVADVHEYLDEFKEDNEDYKVTVINDQSVVVNERIDMLIDNGLIGFFIVLLLLAMFLHYRLAFWVALSIPIAFGGMFILASFFGITINVISLFGMITVIGILVDDGVVISENIYRHFEMGKPRLQAAIEGTMEVIPAVFSAILTTIIVFCTFFFIEGRLGDFFGEMAFIVIATLIFSLIEGIFILPAHVAHSKALDKDAKPNKVMKALTDFLNYVRDNIYNKVITFSLRNPLFAMAIPIGLFIITIGAMKGGVIKSTFFPAIERDNIAISLKMPSGTRESITEDYLGKVETGIWNVNAYYKAKRSDDKDIIESTDKRIGPVNGNLGTINVQLLTSGERGVKQSEIISRLRDTIGELVGVEELSFGSGSPFGKPVSIALQGPEMKDLQEVTVQLKKELNAMSDLKDVTDSDLEGTKEVIITLKDKAYLLGMTEAQVMGQIRRGFFGGEVQRLQRGLDEVKVWVRYNEDNRKTIKQLKDMEIVANDGSRYFLSDLANFTVKRGIVSIKHIDGKREIRVEADLANDQVSSLDVIQTVEDSILPKVLKDYPDVAFSFEGQVREQQKSTNSMKSVVPIVLILMLAVIVMTFRSFVQTFIVLLLIPFGFIGVAWGHFIHDAQISLFSILGTIALIGILINDSLVFVGAFNSNIKSGMSFYDSLKDAALSRFRPILLTSITTIAGLAPLIIEKSFQAQFLIPMALSIAYGLAVATMIILIILPVLLLAANNFRRFLHWWWYDEWPAPETVEPAYKELKFEDHE